MTTVQAYAILLALIMMAGDVISGFIAAAINNEVKTSKMRTGLMHKMLMMLIIAISWCLEYFSAQMGLQTDLPLCVCVCFYLAIMDLLSILENVCKGYPEFRDSKVYRLFKDSSTFKDINGED